MFALKTSSFGDFVKTQLHARDVVQQGNKFRVTFGTSALPVFATPPNPASLSPAPSGQTDKTWRHSPKYRISKLHFEAKTMTSKINNEIENLIFVKFTKEKDDVVTYSIKLTSTALGLNKTFMSDDTDWRLIFSNDQLDYVFDIAVQIDPVVISPFAALYDDTVLTDFELHGVDGSIRVHSAVLAMSSPVLGRMLEGKWQETENRVLEITDTTKNTLQHLKDYMYLHTLPDMSVEQLLLLAARYMMEELETKCVSKLMDNLTASNAMEVLKFAITHNMSKLYFAFLERVESGSIRVKQIRDAEAGVSKSKT